MNFTLIVSKQDGGIYLLIDDKHNAKSAHCTMNFASAGKLAAMLHKAMESSGYQGSINWDGKKATSKEEVEKQLE